MKRIEFFGIAGSGKTNLKNLLKKKNNFFDYNTVIRKFLPNEEKNFFKRNLIKTYLLFKYQKKLKDRIVKVQKKSKSSKNKKKTQIVKKEIIDLYLNLLNRTFNQFKKKNLLFVKFTEKLIKNSNFQENNKKVFLRWFIEESVANYLIEKNKKKIQLIIDSEGFLQRLFIYLYKKKDKTKILKKYISLYKLPHLVLITTDKCFKKKKHLNKEFNLDIAEQKKIYRQTLLCFEKKKINYKIVDRNKIRKLVF